jgi:hypothetical protein
MYCHFCEAFFPKAFFLKKKGFVLQKQNPFPKAFSRSEKGFLMKLFSKVS